ncbi:dephospho-CoA kinase [Thalassococcus lentus]|uniref:Dephospho-CoA kinase n=1 Tax=Thalassococcus lentus TaxID=1210524 RepID=A0ABT4XN79_9RHOB|nr:dephospho-CoA kinase [Thalassococcus lentus]MDA7423398.1 dephospho-CoA kinase [Thalassococcus lentus]
MTFVLGLTGSIGMGKSTTSQMFADLGIPVWDADAVVHKLYAPDGPAPKALEARFPGTIRPDGHVDRDALRALIAKDSTVLDQINAIVHPMVARNRAEFLKVAQGVVVLDVPLLFETGLDEQCDKVAVVTVDAETQKRRVLERGTMTEQDLENILSRQMPDAEKQERADFIIVTDTLEHAKAQVQAILREIQKDLPDA